jgi:hypothetical protein
MWVFVRVITFRTQVDVKSNLLKIVYILHYYDYVSYMCVSFCVCKKLERRCFYVVLNPVPINDHAK